MHFLQSQSLFGLLVSSAAAWPTPGGSAGYLYFLNDDPSGSSIVSLSIGSNGMPYGPVLTSTRGNGAIGFSSTTGAPMTADPMFSQGSVQVYGNTIYTVNSGSNTFSRLIIGPDGALHPFELGQPMPTTGGDFPMSIDFSPELCMTCVLCGGNEAGVSCTTDWGDTLPFMPFPSSLIKQTDPPAGPFGTTAQVRFNPSSTALVVSIKGIPRSKEGAILVYPIEQGKPTTPVVTQIDNLLVPFGFDFLSENEIFISDPSFGVAKLIVNADWTVTQTVHTLVPEQQALCWTQVGPNSLYGPDAGSASLWTFSEAGALTGAIEITQPGGMNGTFDSVIVGNYLYTLGAAPGIVVVDVAASKQVGFVDLSSVGPRNQFTGMAAWTGGQGWGLEK